MTQREPLRMALARPSTVIAELSRLLERTQGHGCGCRATLPFGVLAVDSRLPGGGLALGHLHEVMEGGAAAEYVALATLFTAGILARLTGSVLWC